MPICGSSLKIIREARELNYVTMSAEIEKHTDHIITPRTLEAFENNDSKGISITDLDALIEYGQLAGFARSPLYLKPRQCSRLAHPGYGDPINPVI